MGRRHGGLPHLALLELPVPQQAVGPVGPAGAPGGQGQAVGDGQTLAQGTGGAVQAGELGHVGMALQGGAQLAQGGQQSGVKIPPTGQHAVQQGGGVALGQQEPVPVGVVGAGGVQAHLAEIETDQNLHRRQGAPGMAGAGGMGHGQDVPPDLPAEGGQVVCHGKTSWVRDGKTY